MELSNDAYIKCVDFLCLIFVECNTLLHVEFFSLFMLLSFLRKRTFGRLISEIIREPVISPFLLLFFYLRKFYCAKENNNIFKLISSDVKKEFVYKKNMRDFTVDVVESK